MNEVVIDDSQREMCAVLVMRTMLTDYCNDTGVSFNDVFFRFVTSPAYKMLFDYSTGLWMEGPDYLRNIFEDTMKTNTSLKQPESYLISEEEILEIHVVDDDLVHKHNIIAVFLHKGLCQLLLCQRFDLGAVGHLIRAKFSHCRLDCRCY